MEQEFLLLKMEVCLYAPTKGKCLKQPILKVAMSNTITAHCLVMYFPSKENN